ncbi:MAG: hypothetical protein Q4G21_02530 [Dermabacter sp.]|nr:hypothetical protein [Dermabacter sp.]
MPATRLGSALALAASAVLLILPVLVPSLTWGTARAGASPASTPLTTVYVTSGLTWADLSASTTPELFCFAEHSGVGAMSLTSGSVLTTKRQGLASLTTGERTPPLARGEVNGLPAEGADGLRIIDLGDVAVGPGVSAAEREASLRALDARFAEAQGACGAGLPGTATDSTEARGEAPRVAVASVGALSPAPERAAAIENERSPAALHQMATDLQLQVYIDSGFGPGLLTSPSTRQPGLVLNVDVAPSAGEGPGIGRAIEGTPRTPESESSESERADDEQARADASIARVTALTTDSRLTEDALAPVIGLYLAVLGVAAAGALGLRAARWEYSARARRLQRACATVLGTAILAVPLGLTSSQLPLADLAARGISPALAIVAAVGALAALAGTLLSRGLASLGLRTLTPAVAALIAAALIALEVALGAHAQLGSVLGNQPLYGGRFYGLGNHLTGILLAAWALGIGGLLDHAARLLATTAGRVGLVALTGAALGFVALSPTMGADAGSALIFGPATLLGCLAVSGARLKARHVVGALAAGGVLFALAGLLDYLRPPSARTHLGAFVADLLDAGGPLAALGTVAATAADRAVRMAEPLWITSPLIVVPAAAAIVALTWASLTRGATAAGRFNRAHRWLWAMRASALVGAWIGAATNDTGLTLLVAAYAVGALVQAGLIAAAPRSPSPAPSPQDRPRENRAEGRPRADHSG